MVCPDGEPAGADRKVVDAVVSSSPTIRGLNVIEEVVRGALRSRQWCT